MVVVGVSRAATGPLGLRRKGAERSFQVKAEGASATERAVGTGGVMISSLLLMQEAESDLHQDREARQHGEAVMDELSDLQRALLGGDGPDLARLSALAARPVSAADPALAGVLRAIRVRALIELERRGRATSG